jgi:hypothetical protein
MNIFLLLVLSLRGFRNATVHFFSGYFGNKKCASTPSTNVTNKNPGLPAVKINKIGYTFNGDVLDLIMYGGNGHAQNNGTPGCQGL